MYDLLTLGDLVADLVMPIQSLPVRAGEHQIAAGLFLEPGGMANTLITAQRIGLRTAALGSLGDDAYGQEIRAALAGEGVDVDGVVAAHGATTSSCVTLVDDTGAHVFLAVRGNAQQAPLADDWAARTRLARVFFFNGYLLLYPALVEHARQVLEVCAGAGIPFFFDPGPMIARLPRAVLDDVIRRAYAVMLTTGEAQELLGTADPVEAGRQLRARGAQLVAVKRGADGCYLAYGEDAVWAPGFAVAVKDQAGAGDAFDAAIVREHLRGASPAQMARYANAAGAATVAKMGTGRQMPRMDEIEAVLARGAEASPHNPLAAVAPLCKENE